MKIKIGICAFILVIQSAQVFSLGLKDCSLTPAEEEDSRIEHIFGGAPDDSIIYERRAYLFSYDKKYNVPQWTAWHVIPPYRDTPKRKSRWSTFRTDPELNHVKTKDYIGWYDSEFNYARGHIAPYFISGGDRDHDGKDAEYESDLKIEDPDDACTVFEINAMTNVAPQYHKRFNGSPGVWWQLETDMRMMLDNGHEFYVFAGTVFLENKEVMNIGNRKEDPDAWDIGVPHGYFKMIIDPIKNEVVAFLFDHADDLNKGCNIDIAKWPSNCIVDVSDIESITGLKFFSELNKGLSDRLRNSSNQKTWMNWRNDNL